MKITDHFEFKEFESTSHTDLRLDNVIEDFDVRDNIVELTKTLLEPLREAWGKPIHISSGYRCPKLNKRVGGSATSAHLKGLAADLVPDNQNETEEFIQFAVRFFVDSHAQFDQLIKERNGQAKWLHVGLRNLTGEQRGQVLRIEK